MFRMPWLALYIIACEIFLFCLLNVGVSTSKLQKLYRSVKNCGLTDEEQHQRFELLLSEMEPADRAEVEALQRDKGKTLLEAYNSWKSSTTGRRCVRSGCLCTRPAACICGDDHPHTQHGHLSAANTGFVYATSEAAAQAARNLDNLPDKDPKLSFRVDAKDAKKVVVVLDAGTRKRLKTREKIGICDAVTKHAPGGKAAHGTTGGKVHVVLAVATVDIIVGKVGDDGSWQEVGREDGVALSVEGGTPFVVLPSQFKTHDGREIRASLGYRRKGFASATEYTDSLRLVRAAPNMASKPGAPTNYKVDGVVVYFIWTL